ncbi:MAG: hypothetical protein J6D61_03300, partial [Clostridia bacterium]|nr:hypothetical protein [Clostridia bacterium]
CAVKKVLITVLLTIVLVLTLVIAGAVGYIWYRDNHIFVEGEAYPISARTLDLREEDISFDHYEAVHTQLPDCWILWNVPFQGGKFPSDSETLTVSSLTEEDVALLALHYLHQSNERYGTGKRMGSALFREILAYTWPGNERELKSFIEQMVLVSPGEVLDDPALIRSTARLTASLLPAWKKADDATRSGERSLKEQVSEYELMIIRRSISKYGSLRKAAKALQVDPSVLSRKLSAAKE